jgi:RimJ/RimL family protein N-acetyltransferase
VTGIPVLDTERLVLRAQRPGDTEVLMEALADDGFARFITRQGRGLGREEAWYAIAIAAGSWPLTGYGMWIAEDRATGAAVGRIGPWAPEGWPGFEIAWAIFPQHQNKGYAVEGAAAALVWAHEALGREHVIHLIDPRNTASERVAAALGAEATGEWNSPSCAPTRIWTTRWDRFRATPACQRHLAAGRPCPGASGG